MSISYDLFVRASNYFFELIFVNGLDQSKLSLLSLQIIELL